MKKRGVSFVGKHVVEIVIGVLAVVILISLGSKAFGFLATSNEIEKAGDQLENLARVVREVQQDGKENRIEFFSIKNWYLMTLPIEDYPPGDCIRSDVTSCLCICDNINCDGSNVCKGLEFVVEVDERHHEAISIIKNKQRYITGYQVGNTLKLVDAIYELAVLKENEGVKIRNLR